jgi:hypothetical protein
VIRATREDASGLIVFLDNDEGYVGAEFDEVEGTNWARVSTCESPGVIKAIRRTTTEDKGADYAMVQEFYEKRYGQGERLNTGGTIYDFRHRWRWESPATELSIMKIRGTKFFSIELRDLSLEEKDARCAGQEAPEKKSTAAKLAAGLEGPRPMPRTSAPAPRSEMADNMDPGLTAREALYILSMQDSMHLLLDIIRIQEKLVGGVGPAERDSIRQELKRIRADMRKIGMDSRRALSDPLRVE